MRTSIKVSQVNTLCHCFRGSNNLNPKLVRVKGVSNTLLSSETRLGAAVHWFVMILNLLASFQKVPLMVYCFYSLATTNQQVCGPTGIL